MEWKKISLGCAVFLASVAVIIGALALTVFDGIINSNVLERDHLGYEMVNGTRRLNTMTKSWVHPAYYMQQQIWLYHLENLDSVLQGAKPRVKEIGPFTFVEQQWKSFYKFDQNDTRVFYRTNHVFTFNSTLSCPTCSLKQKVVLPNVIFQKLVDFASTSLPAKIAIEAILRVVGEAPFVNVTVREALFDGYHDPLIDLVCKRDILAQLCKALKIPQRIGFFYKQNNTDDGLYQVSTGLNEPWNIGQVHSFNNMSAFPETVWDSADAREIRGTDGQLFPPLLKEGGPIDIFAGPICRTVTMRFRERSDFRNIAAFRYGFRSDIYDPNVPENRGYCNKNNTPAFFNTTVQIPGCLPKGLLDISRCLPASPRVYISQPHFLHVHPAVISTVDGVRAPDKENDETFVDVEPITGVPIRANKLTQVNIGMTKGSLSILPYMRNMIYPTLWMNETAVFDDGTKKQLDGLMFAKHLTNVIGVTFLTIGLLGFFAIVASVVIYTVLKPRTEDEQPILQEDAEEEVGGI